MRNIESASEPTDSLEDVNLLAELEHLVTDRQTSGIYTRNTASTYIQAADTVYSPDWMRMQLFPFGTDETWEDFMNMGFGFENMDALYISNPVNNLLTSTPVVAPPALPSNPKNGAHESISLEQLKNVIDSIPACNYCRNRRVKCSRRLPACQACIDSKRQCLYYDSFYQKISLEGLFLCSSFLQIGLIVWTSHIHALYTNIKMTIDRGTVSDTVLSGQAPAILVADSTATTGFPRNVSISDRLSDNENFFFGSSSHVAALDLVISMRPGWTQLQVAANDDLPTLALEFEATDHQLLLQDSILPSYPAAATLIQSFSRSVNIFYPTIQQHVLENLLSTAHDTTDTIHGTFEEQNFYIILAIASHLTREKPPSSAFTSNAYFMKGTSGDSIMHEKTSTSQVLLLQ